MYCAKHHFDTKMQERKNVYCVPPPLVGLTLLLAVKVKTPVMSSSSNNKSKSSLNLILFEEAV